MTITTANVGQILAKCSGYRPDRTPNYSELVAMAWIEHFSDFPAITADDALEAVKVYHREPQDRMIQPADISKVARAIRRDRTDREPEQQRQAREEDAWDAELLERNKARLAALINPGLPNA